MSRTTPQDWIRSGFELLVEGGAEALTAQRLAGRLGVTRGSFYHHFGSREGFLRALLGQWEEDHTSRVISLSRAGGTPSQRLERLIRHGWRLPHDVDVAIRAWALRDPLAAEHQRRVDDRRLAYVAELYRAFADDLETGDLLARIAYSSFVGFQQLEPHLHGTEFAPFIDGLHRVLIGHADPRAPVPRIAEHDAAPAVDPETHSARSSQS